MRRYLMQLEPWIVTASLLAVTPVGACVGAGPAGPLATSLAGAVMAQQPEQTSATGRRDAGVLTGRVLDARTGEPVAHAVVTLEALPAGLIAAGGAGVLASVRPLLTGEAGVYRFPDVTPGSYRLRIERLGYRATAIDIDVRRPADAAISVALEFEPVLLEPVRVQQNAHSIFTRTAHSTRDPAADDAARIAAERLRQDLFVTPDTRLLTYNDVIEGVTLAEGDVFRALQRFPGVTTRDDYTAELWSRGAPWPHTRVTFDGVPLLNPVHAVGVLSAIAPDVLGAVFFHPGMRPASVPGGAAAVVDLRTRPAHGSGELRGAADLSLASAKLVLEQDVPGRGSWLVVARHSHLGVLRDGLGAIGLDTIDLPFVFRDVAARADLPLGAGVRIETSGLWEEDRLDGDVAGVLERTTSRWGNAAGRVTLRAERSGVELSQTVGGSRFSVRTDARDVRTRDPARAWTEPASRNDIDHVVLSGDVAPVTRGTAALWSVGYDVTWKSVDYDGGRPRTHAVRPDTARRIEYARDLRVLGVYADARLRTARGRLTVNPGLRIEAVTHASGTEQYAAPRLAVRLAISESQSISAAAGRSWQHIQALGLAGPSVHPAFHASHFWMWADSATPSLRSDVASIGTERWLGNGWLAGATLFARRATGMIVPDPEPGRLGSRPLFVTGENTARGFELSARRIGARWSASLGWTHGSSRVDAAGYRFPSAADRSDVIDATGAVRLPLGFRAAAAFTAMSGAPFTRAYSRAAADCQDFGFGCDNPTGSWIQAPNAERTPPYRSLDIALHWSWTAGRVDLATYMQVRNVLGRDNASTYAGSAPVGRIQTRDGSIIVWDDRFESGLPRLPLAGLRVSLQ